MPVMTDRRPAASTAATASASRTEPPGCTKAETPAARHASTASGNGKNASEAHARLPDRLRSQEMDRALSTAWRAASTRLVWPEPSPTSIPPFTKGRSRSR